MTISKARFAESMMCFDKQGCCLFAGLEPSKYAQNQITSFEI